MFRGPHVFARDDSVLILEPLGTSAVVRGQVVRRDGRTHGFRFSLGVNDPVLAALLSRWCWRDGAGIGHENHPLRDDDVLPSLPASE